MYISTLSTLMPQLSVASSSRAWNMLIFQRGWKNPRLGRLFLKCNECFDLYMIRSRWDNKMSKRKDLTAENWVVQIRFVKLNNQEIWKYRSFLSSFGLDHDISDRKLEQFMLSVDRYQYEPALKWRWRLGRKESPLDFSCLAYYEASSEPITWILYFFI